MTDSKGNAIDLTNENEPNDELKSEVELDNPESFEEDQDGESYQKLYDLAKQETELLGLFLQLMSWIIKVDLQLTAPTFQIVFVF